jgi:hypothetical protein
MKLMLKKSWMFEAHLGRFGPYILRLEEGTPVPTGVTVAPGITVAIIGVRTIANPAILSSSSNKIQNEIQLFSTR